MYNILWYDYFEDKINDMSTVTEKEFIDFCNRLIYEEDIKASLKTVEDYMNYVNTNYVFRIIKIY